MNAATNSSRNCPFIQFRLYTFLSLKFVYSSVMYFHNQRQSKIWCSWNDHRYTKTLSVASSWLKKSYLARNSDWGWGSHQCMGYVPLLQWKWAAGQTALYQFTFFLQQTCYGAQVSVLLINNKLNRVVESRIRTYTASHTIVLTQNWMEFILSDIIQRNKNTTPCYSLMDFCFGECSIGNWQTILLSARVIFSAYFPR